LKANCFANTVSSPRKTARRNFGMSNTALKHRLYYGRKRGKFTVKEPDAETGLYYYGARYLDPKTARWLSGDPAMGGYLPSAPVNEEARRHNQSLPGQGGVFNYVNLHAYHYAGNNPVRYRDPDGESSEEKLLDLCNKVNSFIVKDIFGNDKYTLKSINYYNGRIFFSYTVLEYEISDVGMEYLRKLSDDNACSYGATQFRNEWRSNRIPPIAFASTLKDSDLISYYRDTMGKIINAPSILASKLKIGDILVYIPDREWYNYYREEPDFTGHIATIIGIDDIYVTTLEFHMGKKLPTIQKISKDHLMNFEDCKLYGAAKWNY